MTRYRVSEHVADNRFVAVDREELKAAAFRLKHDLGKAVRWNAPAVREKDTEALRRRLAKDIVETRVLADGGTRSAVEIFEAWMSAESGLFESSPEAAPRLARMSAAIDAIRARLPRLTDLGWDDLVALDDASLLLKEETRALWRETASTAGTGSAR
jgi:hypothetical protein